MAFILPRLRYINLFMYIFSYSTDGYFPLLYKTNYETGKIKTQKAIIAAFAIIAFYSYPVLYPEYKFQI